MAGVESAVRIHIDRGDVLNARDEKGLTPLMLAAARDRAAICQLLLAAGVDASLFDPSGSNALAIARAAGALEAASVIAAACTAQMMDGSGAIELAEVAWVEVVASGVDLAVFETDSIVPRAKDSPPPAVTSEDAPGEGSDDSGFDLGVWEPEEDHAPPKNDTTIAFAGRLGPSRRRP